MEAEPTWKRIAGLEISENGDWSVVWLAQDPLNDVIHVYDACHLKREVLAVIAECLNARGRWVPISWINQEVADELLDRGCNMLPEKADHTDAMAEVVSRDILERMRTGRFKVDKRLSEWLDEYRTFNRKDAHVPRETHPLMAATRHAMADLRYARAEKAWKAATKTYPKVAIV